MSQLEQNITDILQSIGEDIARQGLVKTPQRVANSYKEIFRGYDQSASEVVGGALFPAETSSMVLVKDIEFYSVCEHHMIPFFGTISIAYVPDKYVIGLSKIPRIVDIYARRLQIQELLGEQIVAALANVLLVQDVIVLIKARHMCMMMRGIQRQLTSTITIAERGTFVKNQQKKHEFLNLVMNG